MLEQSLQNMQAQSVDLDQAKRNQMLAKEASENVALDAARKQAERWDRAMTRAFKGILSAPERRRFLMRASEAE